MATSDGKVVQGYKEREDDKELVLREPATGKSIRLAKADIEERQSGKTADTLEGWLEVIDWHFATYGPRAVAVKNQSAYSRRLNYADVPKEQAAALFRRRSKPR